MRPDPWSPPGLTQGVPTCRSPLPFRPRPRLGPLLFGKPFPGLAGTAVPLTSDATITATSRAGSDRRVPGTAGTLRTTGLGQNVTTFQGNCAYETEFLAISASAGHCYSICTMEIHLMTRWVSLPDFFLLSNPLRADPHRRSDTSKRGNPRYRPRCTAAKRYCAVELTHPRPTETIDGGRSLSAEVAGIQSRI